MSVNSGHISALAAAFASKYSCDGNQALDNEAAVKGLKYVARKHVKARDELVAGLEACQKRYEKLVNEELVVLKQLEDPKLNGTRKFVERALKRVRFDLLTAKKEMKAYGLQIDKKNADIQMYRVIESEVKGK